MNNDINLSFTKDSSVCSLQFSQQTNETADNSQTVCLNGRNFVLKGSDSDLQWLKNQFPELERQENISLDILEARLLSLGAENIRHEIDGKVHVFALEKLGAPKPMGHVIIIGGHSTAGKTTIINEIMKLDPTQSELGIDLTPPRSIYDYLEANHKNWVSDDDWKHLHAVLVPRDENYHIHDAVDGQFQFRTGTPEKDMERAKKTAEKLQPPCQKFIESLPHSSILVVNKAHELSTSGKNVVMDTVNTDNLDNHPLEHNGQITKVLVYCKLQNLSDRLKLRTKNALDSGHPEDVRAGTFPLHQYLEVFGPRKKEDKEDDIIDTVSFETVENIIDEQFDAGVQDLRRRNPQQYTLKITDGSILKEKEEERAKLLTAFGFNPSDPRHKTVQLTPRRQWTMRVDTSNNSSSHEIAKTIMELSRKESGNPRKRKDTSLRMDVK